ncbi:hypothetical protein Ddc_12687 [Ditylenchus destructor]|nr:hypothetical protein Ddc_12687 [Ditylenchus destructor]
MADNKKRSPFLLSKQYGRLTGLVKSKFTSHKSKSGGYSVESDDINFNYMATSTPNIHKIQPNGRMSYMENGDLLLNNKRPNIARQSSYYSPQTQRSSYINVPGSGEYVRNRCLSISTVSNSLQRRIEQHKKGRHFMQELQIIQFKG